MLPASWRLGVWASYTIAARGPSSVRVKNVLQYTFSSRSKMTRKLTEKFSATHSENPHIFCSLRLKFLQGHTGGKSFSWLLPCLLILPRPGSFFYTPEITAHGMKELSAPVIPLHHVILYPHGPCILYQGSMTFWGTESDMSDEARTYLTKY